MVVPLVKMRCLGAKSLVGVVFEVVLPFGPKGGQDLARALPPRVRCRDELVRGRFGIWAQHIAWVIRKRGDGRTGGVGVDGVAIGDGEVGREPCHLSKERIATLRITAVGLTANVAPPYEREGPSHVLGGRCLELACFRHRPASLAADEPNPVEVARIGAKAIEEHLPGEVAASVYRGAYLAERGRFRL